MIYHLYSTPHPGGTYDPPQPCASLADALEASGVPHSCWNAVVSTHPDEITTFYSEPGIVPGGAPRWVIRGPGVAAEFCASVRLAAGLPALEGTS